MESDDGEPLLVLEEAVPFVTIPPGVRDRARWLRRRVLEAEKRSGRSLLVRDGRRFCVSLESLRVAVPELFSVEAVLAAGIRTRSIVGLGELVTVRERLEELLALLHANARAAERIEEIIAGRS